VNLKELLPPGSKRRNAIISVAAVAATLLVCTYLLPDGAPLGVQVQGLIRGSRTALLAAALVLIWRNTRIVNFAQVVMGGVAANLAFNLAAVGVEGFGTFPFVIVLFIALLISTGVGMLIELAFVRRFFNSPRLVLTVVTVVMTPVLLPLPGYIEAIPIWNRGPQYLQKRIEGKLPVPFSDLQISLDPFKFGFGHLFALASTVAVFAGLGWFLTRTRYGAAVRGTAENADRALMLGINVRLLSTLVWGIAGFCSGLSAMLLGMTVQFAGAGGSPAASAEALLYPLAAAVLGRMRSLPVTITAALALGIVEESLNWSYSEPALVLAVVLTVVLGGLLLQKTGFSRANEGASASWAASREIRPTPPEMLALPGIRRLRRGIFALIAIALLVFPQAFSPSRVNLASLIAIYAIVALSLVILTGWGGQVSLGQFAFVAVGALAGGKLTADVGLPFWLALPVAAALTAGFAAAVGQPALRLRGPFLAVSTLGFAVAASKLLLDSDRFEWLFPTDIERPTFLFLSLSSERAYYYLCLAFTLITAVVVRRLRAGRTGRVLIALREDPFGVQPFGINATRARLAVFALSGSLAGVAGVLLVHHQRSLDANAFGVDRSIDMFIMAMVGGITSVSGALLGATYIGLTQFLIDDEQFRRLGTSIGLLYLLFASPGGLAALLYGARDAILKIVAMRRRMIVPSLFEDVDPEAIAKRKASFAPPMEGRGLDVLPMDRRYAMVTELYKGPRPRRPREERPPPRPIVPTELPQAERAQPALPPELTTEERR